MSYSVHRRQPGHVPVRERLRRREAGRDGPVRRADRAAELPGRRTCAYDARRPRFDPGREYLLLLSEIDPDLHHAVETGGTYDFNALHNRYFAINGREFPDTIQDNGSGLLPNQPYGALVRHPAEHRARTPRRP